jgi:glycosyltransferase involved in cell wall biosynthesis
MKILFLVNQLLTVCGVSKHFYYLLSGLKEYYPGNEYFVICGGGDAIERFKRLGVPIFVNENIKHETRSIYGYLKGIYDIYKFVKINKIDIIHSHHHYAGNISNIVCKILGKKNIFTNHGIIPKLGILNYFPSNNIISVNEHNYNYIKQNVRYKKIFLIRNGIKRDKCGESNIKGKKLKILVASRLVLHKGIEIYLKAVSLLPKQIKEQCYFYVAGEGKDKNYFEEINAKYSSGVIFLNKISNIQKLLCKTNILINPTISTEGFPTILVEAGLQRNLVISSNFLGYDSILKDNINSLIFKLGDEKALMEKLREAILSYNEYQSIIDNFYLLCKKNFSVEEMVKKTMFVYESV